MLDGFCCFLTKGATRGGDEAKSIKFFVCIDDTIQYFVLKLPSV